VAIRARIERRLGGSPALVLVVRDTGAGSTPAAIEHGRRDGVGLQNVERRLAYQYGQAAALSIRSVVGAGTTVEIRLPVSASVPAEADIDKVIV
jgi:LytS/YehU family sensor histidine kinase